MRTRYKSQLMIAAVVIAFGVAIYDLTELKNPQNNKQMVDLALIELLMQNSEKSSTYQLIPESIMTGLCWRADDGSNMGIYKDVNAGIAQWREHAPDISDSTIESAVSPGEAIDYEQLSNEVSRLSFKATDYTITNQTAEISGVLTIADRRRMVKLEIDITDTKVLETQQGLIELKASAELDSNHFDSIATATKNDSISLCITMQAARNMNIPEPSPGSPLMLSNYY